MTATFIVIGCFAFVGNSDVIEVQRCGPMCLAIIARSLGVDTSYSEVDRKIPHDKIDSSFHELDVIAQDLGLSTMALAWESGEIPSFSKSMAIIPLVNSQGRKHFVVLLRSDGRNVLALDFPGQARWIPVKALLALQWDRNALHIGRSENDIEELVAATKNNDLTNRNFKWVISAVVLVVFVILAVVSRQKQIRKPVGNRSGYTVIELLVAISIVGLLVSILMPAVQAARERARSMACRNNLKQIGIACHAYHATYLHFPPSTVPFVNISGPAIGPHLSAHARMLPYLDHGELYQRLNLNETGQGAYQEPPTSVKNPQMLRQSIPLFVCPTDVTRAGATNYRVCLGTGPSVRDEGTGSHAAKVGAFSFGTALRDQDISDGLATTAFFSEKLIGDQIPATYNPSRDFFLFSGAASMDTPNAAMANCQLPVGTVVTSRSYGGSSWLFGEYNHTWYNHVLTPNSSTPDCSTGPTHVGAFTARSHHDGGVHVCFGDGSVRFANDQIDLLIWRGISSRRGRETFSLDF